jgi:hypothetical protein
MKKLLVDSIQAGYVGATITERQTNESIVRLFGGSRRYAHRKDGK